MRSRARRSKKLIKFEILIRYIVRLRIRANFFLDGNNNYVNVKNVPYIFHYIIEN